MRQRCGLASHRFRRSREAFRLDKLRDGIDERASFFWRHLEQIQEFFVGNRQMKVAGSTRCRSSF
jgi:sigma54-dependent transcription regulator